MMTGDVRVLNQDILVASILLGLTALVGLLGNLLMLRALLRYPSLRVDFFLIMGSLAVADMVSLSISVPRHIIQLTHADIGLTDAWCNASKYLEVGTSLIAAYHLVTLAVLRFILYSTRVIGPPSPVRALALCGGLWIILLLVSVPFLGMEDVAEGLCEYAVGSDVEKDVWMINAFVCFIPIVVMVCFYALTHVMSKRFFADSYSARERQMSRLVTVLLGCFAVCQLPFRVFDIVLWYREEKAGQEQFPDVEGLESMYIAKNYLLCLMMADKAARPVIYAKVGPQLSEAFDEVINCTLCHRAYTQARSGQPHHNRSALATASSKAANGHHSSRIHSTSSNAPLTAMSEVTTSDATNVTDVMASAEELEIVPLS